MTDPYRALTEGAKYAHNAGISVQPDIKPTKDTVQLHISIGHQRKAGQHAPGRPPSHKIVLIVSLDKTGQPDHGADAIIEKKIVTDSENIETESLQGSLAEETKHFYDTIVSIIDTEKENKNKAPAPASSRKPRKVRSSIVKEPRTQKSTTTPPAVTPVKPKPLPPPRDEDHHLRAGDAVWITHTLDGHDLTRGMTATVVAPRPEEQDAVSHATTPSVMVTCTHGRYLMPVCVIGYLANTEATVFGYAT